MSSHDVWSGLPLLLASSIPLLLAGSALLVSRRSPFGAAGVATVVAAALAFVVVTMRALGASPEEAASAEPWWHGVVQLDLATCAMLALVGVLAVVIVRYSRRYLAGEVGLVRYARALLLTLASITLLVISNHLAILAVAWVATSLGLHQLLTFYRHRPQALVAAHKKFLLCRLADGCFVASLALVWIDLGSLRIDVVNALAGRGSPTLQGAAVLLVVAVVLRSAQLPFHGWMTQVMEAPTPVSALLHAGVVNIGGFVMIRLAPLMQHAPIAQGLLLAFGLTTTIIASLVMTTRVSVKVALAWSTIAQMGFMLMECALGAWHLALLHLVAHSLYKAYAFLSAGSVVQAWRDTSLVRAPSLTLRGLAAGGGLVLGVGGALTAALVIAGSPPSASLLPIAILLGLGLAPMMGRALAAGWDPSMRAVGFAAIVAASYVGGHAIVGALTPTVYKASASTLAWTTVFAGLVLLFVVHTVLQLHRHGRFAAWLQPHLFAGLHLDEWFTRMTFRLWPPRPGPNNAPSARLPTGRGLSW